ncbi:NAC domain-containing protein 73-like [Phragmites australis]|uniref:NAC domain-containing protein 73-like n=1 Tax=Phragmites australis TaxID=29695 RepID=UPI002D777E9B|nr:NAC domain-containing protein 73-like [Phragmites australis]
MARSWLITGRGIAKKVRYATHCANRQISELGAEARRECPNCKHDIDNSDVAIQWPGLPAGVKFDPSDLELLEHLEEKIGLGGSEPHVLIDEFIATVENVEGICYSHPENLPGMKKDGNCAHFFHRVLNAYGCGQRKRRRVISCSDHTVSDEHVRWHKTGKSKAIYDNGVKKGWKKIMVLCKTTQRGGKPERAPWVMHQYHLGEEEDEKDGELVVSKIFYQLPTKHMENSETETADEEPDAFASGIGPKTPKTNTPQLRRPNNSPFETEQNASIPQDEDEGEHTLPIVSLEDDAVNSAWCAGEHQDVGEASRAQPNLDESLLCREDPASLNDETLLPLDYPILSQCRNEMLDKDLNAFYGLPDLHNIDLGTPPDLQLSDLQFGSQESLGSWLDRI